MVAFPAAVASAIEAAMDGGRPTGKERPGSGQLAGIHRGKLQTERRSRHPVCTAAIRGGEDAAISRDSSCPKAQEQ